MFVVFKNKHGLPPKDHFEESTVHGLFWLQILKVNIQFMLLEMTLKADYSFLEYKEAIHYCY